MILDEFIAELESPNMHRVAVDTSELLALLKELKSTRELIKHQNQCIESQARYIEEHIDKCIGCPHNIYTGKEDKMGYKHEEQYIEKAKEIQNMQNAEKYSLYMHWCDECPKAYDFTCSGADAKNVNKKNFTTRKNNKGRDKIL